jgi:hypothetical protein
MLMADTMAVFFVILGLLLAFPGLWLLCRGLWPQTVAVSDVVCRIGLLKPFLIGLPATIAMIGAAAALSNLGPPGKVTAVAIVCFYLIIANAGVAGLVTMIGQRLSSTADVGEEWREVVRGGIALELSYLLPILGWFVILPVSMTIGCGACLIALFRIYVTRKVVSFSIPAGQQDPDFEAEMFGVKK